MFKPTRTQSLAKARLHKNLSNNPLLGNLESLSTTKLEKLAKVRDLSAWVKKDGFKEWFLSTDYIEDLMEADLELGIDRIHEILTTPMGGERGDVKPADILKAAEMLLKYTGREPKKQTQIEYKDKEIAQMDEERLDKVINKAFKNEEKIKQRLEIADNVSGDSKYGT